MMHRFRLWLARHQVRSIRIDIEQNERNRLALGRQLDYLLQIERRATNKLWALEHPTLCRRPHERLRVYDGGSRTELRGR